MVESTIDKIKDITVERQIRKLAGVIDEQNDIIGNYGDLSIDIQNLKDSDANQTTQINNIKQQIATDKLATESAITNLQSKDSAQDGTLATHSEQIQGITKSLVSGVQILDGITAGDIKVRIAKEDAASIDSNNYNLGLPVSAEIIQGTGPSMFKVQITMSSGVKVVSNDFVFTTEAIGNDVYISSFTFKAGNQDGYLSADIGLNNGVTIEANNFLVPTDPGVISNITDLQNRVTNIENTAVTDSRIEAIENELNNKADVNNVNQVIISKQIDLQSIVRINSQNKNTKYGIIGNNTNYPFNVTEEVEAFGQLVDKPIGSIAMLDINGNPKNFTAGGGEVWEEVDLNNWPTDWVVGERIKIDFKTVYADANPYVSTNETASHIIEVSITDISTSVTVDIPINMFYVNSSKWGFISLLYIYSGYFNADNPSLMFLVGGNTSGQHNTVTITKSNISTYVRKMWRLRP